MKHQSSSVRAVFFVAATLLVFFPDQGYALKAVAEQRRTTPSPPPPAPCGCDGNLFAGDCTATYDLTGKQKFDNVLDFSSLATNNLWQIGSTVNFSFTMSSVDAGTRKFAFAGGERGFLPVSVPPGVDAERFFIVGKIEEKANPRFEYMGADDGSAPTVDGITFTQICLKPLSCLLYNCSDTTWVKKTGIHYGASDYECCDRKFCGDYSCAPSTKWEKPRVNNDRTAGFENEKCCVKRPCKESVCSADGKMPITGWQFKLGSTEAECCQDANCGKHTCAAGHRLKANARSLIGSTDATCCDAAMCHDYTCSDATMFDKKDDPGNNMIGDTDAMCCKPKNCSSWTCSDSTKWTKKVGNYPGASDKHCCDPRLCSRYTCNDTTMEPVVGAAQRQGSTDEACCIKKLCKDYTCSVPGKFVKKYAWLDNGAPLRGFSDAECCTQVPCSGRTCMPSSQWKPKSGTNNLGHTPEECCDKILCSGHTCSHKTKWVKKVDTNSLQHQGSTDQECCRPLWCVSYNTKFPTKWKRKVLPNGALDVSLQGSTDEECYDKRICSGHVCANGFVSTKTDQGSTDAECC